MLEAVGGARMDLLWWKRELKETYWLSVLGEPVTDASDLAVGCVLDTQQRKHPTQGIKKRLEEEIHEIGGVLIEDGSTRESAYGAQGRTEW